MKGLRIIDNEQLPKTCQITFIIGNGFDLSLQMKTKYIHIYDEYINSPSSSKIVERFKQELKSNAAHRYENWADFEMGMADYANTLSSENELIECVRDFKGFMSNHLQAENDRIIDLIKNEVISHQRLLKEFDRSIEEFYTGLTPNDINQMKGLMSNAIIERKYITFNYTSTLEAFLSLKYKYDRIVESTPIHIHGRLGEDVVLGIDNIEQIKKVPFLLSRKGKRAFIKTFFNEQFDKLRVETAKNIIKQSDIICVYGFSMGESDKTWVDLLVDWLNENLNHHLVVFDYDESNYNLYNRDEIMDVEDEKKVYLLNKLGIKEESFFYQIHIPVGKSIFNFSFKQIVPHTLGVT